MYNFTSSGDSQDISLSDSRFNHSPHTSTFAIKGPNPSLCLDELQFFRTSQQISAAMSRTPDPQPSAQSPNHSSITASSHPLSSGTVGGIVIGVVAVVLIVVLTILYAYGWLPRWCRRSSYPSRKEGMDIVLDGQCTPSETHEPP